MNLMKELLLSMIPILEGVRFVSPEYGPILITGGRAICRGEAIAQGADLLVLLGSPGVHVIEIPKRSAPEVARA